MTGLFFLRPFSALLLPENHPSDFPKVNQIYGHRCPLFRRVNKPEIVNCCCSCFL
jgi:hypothetical protein